MKFICTDFWSSINKKQIDNLRTNHQGVYVLQDNAFRFLTRLSAGRQNLELAPKVMTVVKSPTFFCYLLCSTQWIIKLTLIFWINEIYIITSKLDVFTNLKWIWFNCENLICHSHILTVLNVLPNMYFAVIMKEFEGTLCKLCVELLRARKSPRAWVQWWIDYTVANNMMCWIGSNSAVSVTTEEDHLSGMSGTCSR
jgi:hypothetical protein